MTDMTLTGVALAKAKVTKARYKTFLGFILLVEFLVCCVFFFIPHRFLEWIRMENDVSEKWLQLLAGIWVFLLLYQFIARREPLLGRYQNIANIIGRLGLSALFAFVAFSSPKYQGGNESDFNMALYATIWMLVTAFLLYVFFRRMIIDELQTRP